MAAHILHAFSNWMLKPRFRFSLIETCMLKSPRTYYCFKNYIFMKCYSNKIKWPQFFLWQVVKILLQIANASGISHYTCNSCSMGCRGVWDLYPSCGIMETLGLRLRYHYTTLSVQIPYTPTTHYTTITCILQFHVRLLVLTCMQNSTL